MYLVFLLNALKYFYVYLSEYIFCSNYIHNTTTRYKASTHDTLLKYNDNIWVVFVLYMYVHREGWMLFLAENLLYFEIVELNGIVL